MQLSEWILLQVVRRGRNDLSLVVKERRPRVLLRSVYPIYIWVVVSRRREGVSLPCKANDCMDGNALKIRSNDWWLRCARAWKVVQVLEQVSNAPDTSEVPEKMRTPKYQSMKLWSFSGCQSKSLAYPETINHFLRRYERFEGIDKSNLWGIKYTHFLVM